ncbi:hypothetical protein L810_2367 [Burkholderia sp. AU4i]|nr:hypothetical protein L810_2367 [Burkholderia sp. AU4i]
MAGALCWGSARLESLLRQRSVMWRIGNVRTSFIVNRTFIRRIARCPLFWPGITLAARPARKRGGRPGPVRGLPDSRNGGGGRRTTQ